MTIHSKAAEQFPETLARWEQMQDELVQMVEKEVTKAIITQLTPHLKNRTIIFEESMGSVTFQVTLRDGRKLFITDDDYFVQKLPNKPTWEPRWLHEWEWVQKVQDIIAGYMYLSEKTNTLIHMEMTL